MAISSHLAEPFSVFIRRHVVILFEKSQKALHAVISHTIRDILDFAAAVFEKV
jgi:hypothetical protein